MCEHSLWSHSPADLGCEAKNSTRDGLQNNIDLGTRASQRLRQMKALEEAEMKTKVGCVWWCYPIHISD